MGDVTPKKAPKAKRYVAVVGVSWLEGKSPNSEKRVEAGQSIPARVVDEHPWLLRDGAVREVTD